MSVQHCGETRDTPFCPQCGAELTKLSPIVKLLRHLNVSRDSAASIVEKMQERGTESATSARLLAARQRVVDKWQGWIDAILELQRLAEQSERKDDAK